MSAPGARTRAALLLYNCEFLRVALQAAAACSVFLGTISPTAAVPHTTRRRSSFGLAATLAGVSSEDLQRRPLSERACCLALLLVAPTC